MKFGLREKIIIITVSTFLLAIGVNTLVMSQMFRTEYSSALQSKMHVIANTLKSQVEDLLKLGISIDNVEGFEAQCQEILLKNKDVSYVMVTRLNGEILFHNDTTRHNTMINNQEILKVLKQGQPTTCLSESGGQTYYNTVIPVEKDQPGIAVTVGFSARLIDEKIEYLCYNSFLVSFISLGITTLLLLSSLSVSVIKPLTNLLTTIQKIRDSSDLDQRVVSTSKDEIGLLASSFNQMTEDLKKTTVSVETLQQEQKRFKDVVENTEEWIWEVDVNGLYTYSSPIIEGILGYTPNEIVGKKHFYDLFCPQKQAELKKAAFEAFSKKQAFRNFVNLNIHKNGQQVWVSTSAIPILGSEGNLIGYRGADVNITERVKAEEALKQAKKYAEAANSSKSLFLANMSHEIRTPMNAIVGFSDILKEEELTEEQTKYVDVISGSANALLQLINDILDFSKIEAGKLETEIIECNVGEILEHLDSMLRPNAINKHIDFGVFQCGQLPKSINSDPVRLRQCLINLVNNAIKFTEQGHVYLNVSVEEDDQKQYVRFDVEDTGIGIEPEKLEKIFNAFSQADGSTTRKYGGTGLGLAITKQLAELLDGKLLVNSTPGKGSTFSIIIPTGTDKNDTEGYDKYQYVNDYNKAENDNSKPVYHGKVLVAEDNISNQTLVKLLLKKVGLEPVLVEDGQEAVKKVQSEQFDLILMDIQMPVMTGHEATKLIRKNGYMTPIVALTANAMKEDEAKCMEAGCDGYLSKPINRDKLYEVLNKYLVKDTHKHEKTS
ncbi:MAG: response regulator [Sedimentisphaerales bacterium]|nr:response regulator [Sedimentisphaerales bacterium]